MTGGWGCPHEDNGKCGKVLGRNCDPGMKGCALSGRYTFSTDEKNRTQRQKQKVRKKEDSEG